MAKKRAKSDVLPGIPFEFDFFMVYWEDIQSDSGLAYIKRDTEKANRLFVYLLVGL